MRSKILRFILPPALALAISGRSFSAGVDDAAGEQTPPAVEEHAIDAKVQEIIKNSKSPDDAVRTLRQMVMQDPNNAELWYQVSEACYAAHDYEKALSAYKKCVALDPSRKGIWDTIASLDYDAGDTKGTLDALKNALVADPKDMEALNTTANILLEMGKLDPATAVVEKAEGIDPKYERIWNTDGRLHAKRQEWKEAIDAYTKAIEVKPDYSVALLNRGSAYLEMGDPASAIADFKKITETNPDYTMGWVSLMQADWDYGHVNDAVAVGRSAVARYPGKAVLWEALGLACIHGKDQAAALDALQKAKSLDPRLRNLETYIASAQGLGGSDADADAELKKALSQNPRDGYSLGNLGRLYLKQGKVADAVDVLEQAGQLLPKNGEIQRLLGEACLAAGRDDEAKASLDKAMALGENSGQFWFAYGLYYERARDFSQALADFQVASKMEPANGIYFAHIADMLRMDGMLDDALKAAETAVQLSPQAADPYTSLGNIYKEQNKNAEAAEAFQKAVSLNAGTSDSNAYVREGNAEMSERPLTIDKVNHAQELFEKAVSVDPKNVIAIRLLGVTYMAQKKYADAANAFARAEAITPGNDTDLMSYANSLVLSGQYDAAEQLLTRLMPTQGNGTELWRMFFQVFKGRGKTADAIPFFKDQLKKQPGNGALYFALGDSQLELKDYKAAAQSLKKANDLKKDDASILSDYGQVLMMLNDPAAIDAARYAHKIKPGEALISLAYGNVLLHFSKLQDAQDVLESLVAEAPDSPLVWGSLLACYKAEGKKDAVARCVAKLAALGAIDSSAVQSSPAPLKIPSLDDAMAAYKKLQDAPQATAEEWFNAGRDLYDNKQYPEAEAALRKAVELGPQFTNAWCTLGDVLLAMKKYDDALADFQKSLERDPAYPRAFQGLALAQYALQHFPEAETAAARYVATNPDSKDVWNVLLSACIAQKEYDKTHDYATKAEALHPDWTFAWLMDGYALKGLNQPDQAIAQFQKVSALEPTNPWGLIGIGRTYSDAGEVEKSIAPYQRATEIAPANPNTWNCLGYSTFLLGRTPEAIGLYQKSIACDDKFETAWINLARAYAKQGDTANTAGTCDRIAAFNPTLAAQLRAELNVK